MSDIAISVQNLSKRYRIGKTEAQTTKRRSITRRIASPFQYLYSTLRQPAPDEVIWALKDVSFEVKHGEVLGIIGRNGAGKTTLLKILSRITEPTSGRAILNGRVGSLLEVGTGFHPELTGRENIYLSGAILGMKKAEIDRKFDEIVDFSGVEKFIDTPVKRYSSGMRVRLAFAVAAHLEPEILLIDEVLAVGDLAFQNKCLGKMKNVTQQGRTIIFVSHNMGAISNLCKRVSVLNNGYIDYIGEVDKGIQAYISQNKNFSQAIRKQKISLPLDQAFRLMSFSLEQEESNGVFYTHLPIFIRIKYQVIRPLIGLRIGFDLKNAADGNTIFRSFHDDNISVSNQTNPGYYEGLAELPKNFLAPKNYIIDLTVGIHAVRWIIHEQVSYSFSVTQIKGVNAIYSDHRPGILMPFISWKTSLLGLSE